MANPIPKDLKGEERIFAISFMDLYLNKTGMVYNGAASILSALILKITNNVILFFILFIGLNILVYPLAQSTTKKSEFEGGNVRRDKYLIRKFKYRKKRKIYLRKMGK